MAIDETLADRGRAFEDEYFRKKDRELVENMRRVAEAEQARRDLTEKTGLDDPQLLHEIQALGFDADTVGLLPFVPLVEVAWAEGGVTDAERRLLVELARSRGIDEGSAGDRLLSAWMTTRPAPEIFAGARRIIAAMFQATAQPETSLSVDELVDYSERIAAASGGILGLKRISPEERAVLTALAEDLKHRKE